jgi:hypothetical protein
MKLSVSKEANPNYLAKVVELKNVQKHSNADRLQTVVIDFQTVITGLDANNGDLYVYFPVECKINKEFLSFTNSFREKELNSDVSKVGFFEENCRVKAMSLRGEKSCGYIVPIKIVEDFSNIKLTETVGQEFDTIGSIKMLEKYVVKERGTNSAKQGKKPAISRLVDGQIHLHIDTENLRKHSDKIKPNDIVSITYKTHGTSYWVSNVLVKRKLSWFEKLVKKFGVSISETEYDLVYGSRRVVKNADLEDPKAKDHFFGYDLWEDIKNEIGELIPKGITVYGEYLGFDKNGKHIQGDYDYGCKEGEHKIEVYRITHTNIDGLVTEFNYPQIEEFCNKVGLTPSHLFYYGKAKDAYVIEIDNNWSEKFIKQLEKDYNEKNCFQCKNIVPEEGIVVRKESLFNCESYKLKSFAFLEKESKDLDKGEINIEDNA